MQRRAGGRTGRGGQEERREQTRSQRQHAVGRSGSAPHPATPASVCGRSQHPERTLRAPTDPAARPKSQRW